MNQAVFANFSTDYSYTDMYVLLFQARIIFEKAVEVSFAKVEELADVCCADAEMELNHEYVREIKLTS